MVKQPYAPYNNLFFSKILKKYCEPNYQLLQPLLRNDSKLNPEALSISSAAPVNQAKRHHDADFWVY